MATRDAKTPAVSEDWQYSEAVQSYDNNEVVFAVRRPAPAHLTMAIEFVRQLCGHPPITLTD